MGKDMFCEVSQKVQSWTHIEGSLFICPCCGSESNNGKVTHVSLEKKESAPRKKKFKKWWNKNGFNGHGRPGPKPHVSAEQAKEASRRLLCGERMPDIASELKVSYHALYRAVVRIGGNGLKRWNKNR